MVAAGTLMGIKVIVWERDQARKLFSEGFYGKPFGIRKPKGADFDAPLELTLIEALYLAEKGRLVVASREGRRIPVEELRELVKKRIPRGLQLYTVYKDLRDRGFIVRSGLKFGVDYAVYELGPGIDHAPYLVQVIEGDELIDPVEIVRAGRLSHSVRKRFIIAMPHVRVGSVKYIMFKWLRP